MRKESLEEELARTIVQDLLELPVEHYDDGSEDSMPDAVIRTHDGELHPLEVIRDAYPVRESLEGALDRHGRVFPLPVGSQGWFVNIRPDASVKSLKKELPSLLAHRDPCASPCTELPEELIGLGVSSVAPLRDGRPRIELREEPWGSRSDDSDLNDYVEAVLERSKDVQRKLHAFRRNGPGHVFIWIDRTSAWPARATVRNGDLSLPSTRPRLPRGIAHVWLAAMVLPSSVVHFDPTDGWLQTNRPITRS